MKKKIRRGTRKRKKRKNEKGEKKRWEKRKKEWVEEVKGEGGEGRGKGASGSSGLGFSPGWEYCVVFLGKTLYSYSASLHPGTYKWVPAN